MSTLQSVFVLAFLVAVVIGLPFWMVACLRDLYRSKSRRQSTVALGNALQELDRLVARPSLQHKVEVESQVREVDDDRGGE